MPSTDNDQRKHFVVTLSPDDLFGSGALQKPSNSSILVNCNSTWYKYPISVDERDTLKEFIQVTDNPHKISFRTEKKGRLSFFKYDAVKYDPLTDEEAHRCLKGLMSNLHVAIEAYHSDSWAHVDIRLENVCFNSNFEPVLIDLDRSINTGFTFACEAYTDSCMYAFMTGEQLDYLQLGWLAIWVAMPSSMDYHHRKFDGPP